MVFWEKCTLRSCTGYDFFQRKTEGRFELAGNGLLRISHLHVDSLGAVARQF